MMEKDLEYFTIEAPSPREALEKMRRHYGQEARILTHKSIRRGGFFGLFAREGVEITGYVSQPPRQKAQASIAETRSKILADARREQSLQLILKEIQTLKENIRKEQPAEVRLGEVRGESARPAGLAKIESIMQHNDFSPAFIGEILKRIRREFSLEDLDNFAVLQTRVLEWIGEQIQVYPPLHISRDAQKVFILVGPTGVGKTTTVAKLAAIYGVSGSRSGEPNVRIVTIDNYRIAALKQIETYAEIMRIPVACVESGGEFKKFLAMAEGSNLILVDTIGRSPRDMSKLAEMKEVLDAAGTRSEIHLAVSATTKASDVEEILKTFEPFKYKAVILTKIDETLRIGNIISVLAALHKPISYIADGQSVPQDIEQASVLRLLMNLEGFHCNREQLEKRFGERMKINDAYWS